MKKSIYTLQSISPKLNNDGEKYHYLIDVRNNFECYIDDIGIFSSIKKAENVIRKLIEKRKDENLRWHSWERYFGFIITEHYIDDALDKYGNVCHFESCRSYLSDGSLNCISECDERCCKEFKGTKHPNKHIKKGDIALVLAGSKLIPVLVEEQSMTTKEWKINMEKNTVGDFTDDSGLVFSAYNGHMHPLSPMLFPLSCLHKAKISKDILKKIKKLRKGYFEGTML